MMWDLILNGATLDVLGLTAFAATVYLLVGRPKRRRLRVVSGVGCWCVSFWAKRTNCYCVTFKDGAPVTDYDGRISAKCQTTCQAGECGYPRTVDGCGGCCGCLGGCAEGYEEQLAEEESA